MALLFTGTKVTDKIFGFSNANFAGSFILVNLLKVDFTFFLRQLLETTLTVKRMKEEKVKIFNNDGTIKETELKIMNFRPIGTNAESENEILNKQWEEVRVKM